MDNVFVGRLWRTVKYEEVSLKDYKTVREAQQGLWQYFTFYNHERLHQGTGPSDANGSISLKKGIKGV